jgi:cytochrome c biogenesis protein CcmG/thiol:disulfide interchange protein DsbE
VAVAVVLLAVGIVVAAVLSSGGHPDVSPVATARGFTLAPVLAGKAEVTLPPVPGRPVVLAFFASWCAPCQQEVPLIEADYQRWAGSPTAPEVVGVDELDQKPDGPDMVRQLHVTFPAGYDHDGSVGQKWDLDGLPITVFIAPDGQVVDYHRGQLGQRELATLVARLGRAS